MVSSLNPAWSLTIYNTAASPQALQVISIVALIFTPVAVAYESWSYYIFRFIKIREGGKYLKETCHLITNTIHRPIKAVQYCQTG
jgi:cytochrome bd-type quinol oxidase subunit 2